MYLGCTLNHVRLCSDEVTMVYDLRQGLIRLGIVCTLVAGVSSFAHGADSCAKAVVRSWTASVETIEDRLKLILSLLREHPDLVTANLQYRRSLLELYSHVPELQKALGDQFASLEIHGPKTVSLKYAKTADGMIYDEQAIGVFKQDRIKDLKAIRLYDQTGEVQTMADVLRQGAQRSSSLGYLAACTTDAARSPRPLLLQLER